MVVAAGQRHEAIFLEKLLDVIRIRRPGRGRPRRRPDKAAGDKGYSTPRVRRAMRRLKIKRIIP